MEKLKVLDLFSGIGGFSLGAAILEAEKMTCPKARLLNRNHEREIEP